MKDMKLTLKDIPASPVKFGSPCTLPSIRDIAEGHYGVFDLNVWLPTKGRNLQRELVWSLTQKQAFVLSILQNKNIPPLSVNQKCDHNIYEVIDGKQRIATAVEFYNNEFPIFINNETYFIKDFDHLTLCRFSLFTLCAYHHMEFERCRDTILTDDQKIEWFLYVNNSGTPQQDSYLEILKSILYR